MKSIMVNFARLEFDVRDVKCYLTNVAFAMTSSRFSLSFMGERRDGEGRIDVKIAAADTVIDDVVGFFKGIKYNEKGDICIIDKSYSESKVKECLSAIAICISGHTHPLSFPINTDSVIRINGEVTVLGKIRKIIEGITFPDTGSRVAIGVISPGA